MKDFFEKLEKAKSETVFEEGHKQAIHNRLIQFMKVHAVRERGLARHIYQQSFIQYLFKPMPIIALILIVALGGGTTMSASASALPGELLYGVKIHIKERVESFLAFSTKAKAEVESRHAQERLNEAVQLAAGNKLNEENSAILENSFEAQASAAHTHLAQLEAEGNESAVADVSSQFEASLRARGEVLDSLEARSPQAGNLARLRLKVNSVLGAVGGIRGNAEVKIAAHNSDEESTASGKLNAASHAVASAQSFIERKKGSLAAGATAQAEVRVKAAQDLITQGNQKAEAHLYGEAFNLGNRALQLAQESKTLVEMQSRLKGKLGIDLSVPSSVAADVGYQAAAAAMYSGATASSAATSTSAQSSSSFSNATSSDNGTGVMEGAVNINGNVGPLKTNTNIRGDIRINP